MQNSASRAKRSNSIHDTAAEQWSRVYIDVRASYGRAAIQAAILLNGGASVALLAFLGNLAIAQQTKGITGNFGTFKGALRVLWNRSDAGREQQCGSFPDPECCICTPERGRRQVWSPTQIGRNRHGRGV